MQARRSKLSDEDQVDWAQYARHVRPLPGRSLPQEPPGPAPPSFSAPAGHQAGVPRTARQALPAIAIGVQPPGVDNATWQRFRTGKLAAARTLDLHGRTAQRGFHALVHFLEAAHADRLRCVEIITGRGVGEAGGVLRRELPLWLNLPDLRRLVLAASHPHPANPGSVRVLLRRVR
jgi:DNA-nicking Smr family endonuclease